MAPQRTEDPQGSLFFMDTGPTPGSVAKTDHMDRVCGSGPRDLRALPLVSRTHTASQYLSTYETAWEPEDLEVKQVK